jgi:hypothetical protein
MAVLATPMLPQPRYGRQKVPEVSAEPMFSARQHVIERHVLGRFWAVKAGRIGAPDVGLETPANNTVNRRKKGGWNPSERAGRGEKPETAGVLEGLPTPAASSLLAAGRADRPPSSAGVPHQVFLFTNVYSNGAHLRSCACCRSISSSRLILLSASLACTGWLTLNHSIIASKDGFSPSPSHR